MHPELSRALLAPELWLTLRRTSAEGRASRDYAVLDPAGAPLLQARAFNWSREIRLTDATGSVVAVIRRSRAFALNGRAEIVDAAGQRLGQVRRTGAFADAGGRTLGRFRDARTFGSRAGESVLQGVVDAALGGEGSITTSGPESFVLLVEERLAGSLVRAVLPWAEPAGGEATSRRMPQWLAGRIRSLTTTRGWRFQRDEPTGGDPLVTVAAALFAIELSRW